MAGRMRMLAFHRDYPDAIAMGQLPVAQLPASAKVPQPVARLIASSRVPQLVAQLREPLLWPVPRAHHVILMDKVPDLPTRRWYMEQTLANGWSRNVLALQIDARAHERQGKAASNFAALLPAPQSPPWIMRGWREKEPVNLKSRFVISSWDSTRWARSISSPWMAQAIVQRAIAPLPWLQLGTPRDHDVTLVKNADAADPVGRIGQQAADQLPWFHVAVKLNAAIAVTVCCQRQLSGNSGQLDLAASWRPQRCCGNVKELGYGR